MTPAISELAPRLLVFYATSAQPFLEAAAEIRALGKLAGLAIGGPGACQGETPEWRRPLTDCLDMPGSGGVWPDDEQLGHY